MNKLRRRAARQPALRRRSMSVPRLLSKPERFTTGLIEQARQPVLLAQCLVYRRRDPLVLRRDIRCDAGGNLAVAPNEKLFKIPQNIVRVFTVLIETL